MKNEKGITLIALIITIIVMLILVGVTINVALNGGLFEKAKDARDKTQKEVEREELLSIALGLYDVNSGIDKDELEEKIPNTYKIDTEKTDEEYRYIVEGESGTLWQINLETAEVKENPWVGWGLTSPNVLYNTDYVSEYDSSEDKDIIRISDNGSLFMQFEKGHGNIMDKETIDGGLKENPELIQNGDTIYAGDLVFKFTTRTNENNEVERIVEMTTGEVGTVYLVAQ